MLDYNFKIYISIYFSVFFAFRSILEKNGSAVDATLATMFCNGVFTMQSMGLGGGFLMTIYNRQNKTAYTLNAREKAPQHATTELYKTDKLKSQTG